MEIVNTASDQVIGTTSLMVRVRKNANTLTTAERSRLLAAFATLNNRGMGRFADFRNVHTRPGTRRRTRTPGSLRGTGRTCWIWSGSCSESTRASLCPIGDSTSRRPTCSPGTSWASPIPAPAECLFSATNPLQFWATDGVIGIVRRPRFNTQTQRATSLQGPVITEPETFQLGLGDQSTGPSL